MGTSKLKHSKQADKSKKLNFKRLRKFKIFVATNLWRKRTKFGKVLVIIATLISFIVGCSYGIAQWYIIKHRNEPLTYGATFVPNYARYFDLDPKETLNAMISDLGLKRLRLVSYWKDIEREPGIYNFDELDWQFDMAEEAGVEVSLAIGLRQPRWPECHGPAWAMAKPMSVWREDLKVFMGKVVDRYKSSPALKEYQLENEFFLSVFGECPDFSRDRLVDEFNFVKAIDPIHPIVISRSNNAVGFPVGDPVPDQYAVSVYKRVWDKTLTKRYYEYPFPAWFYGFLAGGGEIIHGKTMFIHELQTEAWLAEGFNMRDAPIEELYKTLSPARLHDRIRYGKATGMRQVDLWGVEWWYQMKTKRNAPELWDTAKKELELYR